MNDIPSGDHASQTHEPHWRIPPWSWPVLISALAWTVITIAIPPARQDFPLGDDWAFARGAIWFAHGEGIHYSNWASMPQLGQWLWSWPFLLVMGPPHFALRVSVIVLSWLGVVSFYDLLAQNNVPARLAGFATCVFALNPLFFISQGTYMTDVPALSFALIALNCYSRAINGRDLRWLSGAVLVAVLGAITRQNVVAVPMVAGLVLVRFPEIRLKPWWVLSILVPVAACLGTSRWFFHRADIMPMQLSPDWTSALFRAFLALHWCGLAVLPLCLFTWRRQLWGVFVVAFLFMILGIGYIYYFAGEELPNGGCFPYSGGMITPCGAFSDGLVAGHPEILLTKSIRIALSILGCIGGAEILTALVEAAQTRKLPGLLMLFTALQLLFVLALPASADRYLELLFPGAIFLVVVRYSALKSVSWPAALMVAAYGVASIGLVHDWFSWNAARWELGRQAVATQHLRPNDIEGGFEWDGWYASADPGRSAAALKNDHERTNHHPALALSFSRSFFPQVTGRYALAFSPPQNSVVITSLPYRFWLQGGHREFLLVQYQGQ